MVELANTLKECNFKISDNKDEIQTKCSQSLNLFLKMSMDDIKNKRRERKEREKTNKYSKNQLAFRGVAGLAGLAAVAYGGHKAHEAHKRNQAHIRNDNNNTFGGSGI
jgi:hypothetical protein